VQCPENLDVALKQAAASHQRLVLLVGPTRSGKTSFLRNLAKDRGLPLINLGAELSRRLLPLTARQRELKTADVIADMVQEPQTTPVLVDNTEIVFDPNLKLNVGGLLNMLSRNTLIVWAWQGVVLGDVAVYGTKGHRECRTISLADTTTIAMTETGA